MNAAAAMPNAAPFWQRRYLWLLLAIASSLPFCFVTVLPMVDIGNHISRYYIFLNLEHSTFLQKFYALHWSLIGNLGVDVLVRAIGPLFGVETATRIIVACIPALTVSGIYAVSKSVSGAVTPGALVSVSVVYNWPFISGFVNFSLAAAVALLVFALWARLRNRSFTLRFLVFAPLAFVTFVAHTAGWGLLGLMVLAYEMSRPGSGGLTFRQCLHAGIQTLPFAVVVVFIIFWRTTTASASGSGISMESNFLMAKAVSVGSIWRERYLYWDLFYAIGYAGLAACLYVYGGRCLVVSNAAIFIIFSTAFLLCPHVLFESSFADRRLVPYVAMFLPLAIGVSPVIVQSKSQGRRLKVVAVIAVVFFCARILMSCLAWHDASREAEAKLQILNSVPVKSRVLGLVVESCSNYWARLGRPDHLQHYALLRRDSIINGMFQNPGLNQVEVLNNSMSGFNPNMGTVVKDERCPVAYIAETFQSTMAKLPVELFDYVWIIRETATGPFDASHLVEVSSVGNDTLYKVLH